MMPCMYACMRAQRRRQRHQLAFRQRRSRQEEEGQGAHGARGEPETGERRCASGCRVVRSRQYGSRGARSGCGDQEGGGGYCVVVRAPVLDRECGVDAALASLSSQGVDAEEVALSQDIQLFTMDDDFDAHYGLLAPQQTVIVRPYSDDSDDTVLQEIKPRFIVMYEPNLEFIRRIEVRFAPLLSMHLCQSRSDICECRSTGTRIRAWACVCIL